jgi:hypothetical protein
MLCWGYNVTVLFEEQWNVFSLDVEQMKSALGAARLALF